MERFIQVLYGLVLLLVVVFILQNLESVQVRFLFMTLKLPIIVLMLGMFLLGFAADRLFFRKKDKKAS
jgi:uncharacterized integral membrane protein